MNRTLQDSASGGLRMANVQKAIGLRRETRMHATTMQTLCQIGINDLLDEMTP